VLRQTGTAEDGHHVARKRVERADQPASSSVGRDRAEAEGLWWLRPRQTDWSALPLGTTLCRTRFTGKDE
jgi:hypothetical protein